MTLTYPGYDVEHGGDLFTQVTAVFDPSGYRRYRYHLSHIWDPTLPPVVFAMLNPSTATAVTRDPTITRCVDFARRFRAGGMIGVNLFAWRATDPRELRGQPDPVGPANDWFIDDATADLDRLVIAAWGADLVATARASQVETRLRARHVRLCCLGTSLAGAPRHPLYLPASTRPVRYPIGQ